MKTINQTWEDIDFIRHQISNEKQELKCIISKTKEISERLKCLEDDVENIIIGLERSGY